MVRQPTSHPEPHGRGVSPLSRLALTFLILIPFVDARSDMHDAALPFLPILTWNTPHTSQLLTATCISLLILAPIVIFIPLRPTLLVAGLAPLLITHPVSLRILPALLYSFSRRLRWRAERLIDNDNLEQRHWHSDKHEVELWENERWSPNSGWSKSILKVVERKAWTTGPGPWCNIASYSDGDVKSVPHIILGISLTKMNRNLTFMLFPGYEFIETENWRLDREGKWEQSDVDDCESWCVVALRCADVFRWLGVHERPLGAA